MLDSRWKKRYVHICSRSPQSCERMETVSDFMAKYVRVVHQVSKKHFRTMDTDVC